MVSLEIVCDTPTPSSSTMNDATTAATDRSWRNSRMSRKPADTSMSPATIRVQGANLRASRTTYRPPIIDTIAPGNVTSPAASGDSPRTSCRCCEVKNRKPIRPTMDRKLARIDELNGP